MQKQLATLLSKLKPVPNEWRSSKPAVHVGNGEAHLECLLCESYTELVGAWKQAMTWVANMDIGLSSLLAVAGSTGLQDDQLWMRLLSKPGTAKTTLCEALAVNKDYTHPISILTGLHSGYKGEGSGDDASLIPKLNGKTAIINEGDVLLKAPNREQIMSELRDLYFGVARSHYRNGKQVEYNGIRMSMILAGTPSIRALNRSALGDRFIDYILYEKESDASERQLVLNVLRNKRASRKVESNGAAASRMSPEMVRAYQLTGGYLGFLRTSIADRLDKVQYADGVTPDKYDEYCEALGKLVADMRARPGGGEEEATEAELHIRLANQLGKFGECTSVCLQLPIGREVMARTARIARDTCYGTTFDVCRVLHNKGPHDSRGIAAHLNCPDDKVSRALNVLLTLGCIRVDNSLAASGARYRRAHIYQLSQMTALRLNKLKQLLGTSKL